MSSPLGDIAETSSLHDGNSMVDTSSRASDSDDYTNIASNRSCSNGDSLAARPPQTFKRQGSDRGDLLASPTTMNRVSNVSCIETGLDISGKEHYAQIRRNSDCRPMGKVVRRHQSIKRLVNATRHLLHLDNDVLENVVTLRSHNSSDNSSEVLPGQESESVHLSQHGRLSVRAATRTVSVLNLVASSLGDNDGAMDDSSGKSFDSKSEEADFAMDGDEDMTPTITTMPLKGGSEVRQRRKSSLQQSLTQPQPPAYHLETTTQYRLNGTRPSNTMASRVLALVGISTSSRGIYDDAGGSEDDGCSCWGINPNSMVKSYLHWTFRQSFLAVFFSAALGFFGFTLIFGLLILWSGYNHPQCLHVNGENFSNYTGATSYRDFGDAYALSWTSFSTVGYGLVYPSTSAVHGRQQDCAGISMLCTLESFVGILFASFCGAVMFAKVGRIRSHAQVMFSDAIVIRYGTGVLAELKEDDSSQSGRSNETASDGGIEDGIATHVSHNECPCPILEFRIANRLHGTHGGEIMDCSMNIVASIDASQAGNSIRKATNSGRRRKGKRIRRKQVKQQFKTSNENDASEGASSDALHSLALDLREHAKQANHQAFEEDPSGKIVPKRIFAKLEIETPDHPFFKRVWTARHNLDLESPILSEEAKQMIRLNRGFWPNELNDPESVRASINLDQILVSLSGTSNADANSVYSQKIYDHHDMNIGYRFVNMIFRDPRDGSLKVDTTVINDVVEQAGGGGEPLHVEDMGAFSEILVL